MNKCQLFLKMILMFLLLAFSSFEYFFRSPMPMILLSLFSVVIFIPKVLILNSKGLIFIVIFFLLYIIQVLVYTNYSLLGALGKVFQLFAFFVLAVVIGSDFKKCFIDVMVFVATYSLLIYFIAQIPSVGNYLINVVSSKFPSLNNSVAIQEGGGINFVIYNFQYGITSLSLFGFLFRNCGPFWEPGLFAVYLNLALYLNLFLSTANRYVSIILTLAIVTTFSTGGFFAMLFIYFVYIFKIGSKSIFAALILLSLLIGVAIFVSEIDFLGIKLLNQIEQASVGSDESRFGAILTQINMIIDSPLIGGLDIKNYTSGETLASGLLIPLVNYGIPIGILYYLLLYKACVYLSVNHLFGKSEGRWLFVIILVLSLSQTILLLPPFVVMLFLQFKKT